MGRVSIFVISSYKFCIFCSSCKWVEVLTCCFSVMSGPCSLPPSLSLFLPFCDATQLSVDNACFPLFVCTKFRSVPVEVRCFSAVLSPLLFALWLVCGFNLNFSFSFLRCSPVVVVVWALTRHHGGAVPQRGDDSGPALPAVRVRLLLCQRARRDRHGAVQRCEYTHALKLTHRYRHLYTGSEQEMSV